MAGVPVVDEGLVVGLVVGLEVAGEPVVDEGLVVALGVEGVDDVADDDDDDEAEPEPEP